MRNCIFFLFIFMIGCSTASATDIGLLHPDGVDLDAGWIVLDCRTKKQYDNGHVPGAMPFSWENFTLTDTDGVQYRILPAKELAIKLGNMGIHEKSKVLLYGDADQSWGGEGWGAWVFAWLGHQGPLRLLEGGASAWQKRGFFLEKEMPAANPVVTYTVDINPDVVVSVKNLLNDNEKYTLIDVRSSLEWLKGSLPGAVHINWKKFYSGPYRTPLNAVELKKLLSDAGVDPQKPVVYFCTGGIRSGYAWLVHELSDISRVKNFEGGTEAWSGLTKKKKRWFF